MKTIFITIGTGVITRNLVLNNFFDMLRRNYRVVVFSPRWKDPDFLQVIQGPNVVAEEFKSRDRSWFEERMCAFETALIYNRTVDIHSRYGLVRRHKNKSKKELLYFLQYIIFGLFLSKISTLRDIARAADRFLWPADDYEEIFERYKPTAVFATNITNDGDIFLLRAAKTRGVLTFAMAKTWDNLSKVGLREKADYFVAWSAYMRDEAIKFHSYKPRQVAVVGVPQFDIYHGLVKNKFPRELFIETYKLDPKKKTVLFTQRASPDASDDVYVAGELKNWIEKEYKPYQILIRPHFGYHSFHLFEKLVDNKVVFMDRFNKPSGFKDTWDFSPEHFLRLALSMWWSDVVVTSTSTTVLDAIAAGNRIVCYNFDKERDVPFGDSVRRRFATEWFYEIQKTGLEPHIVRSEKELIGRVDKILHSDVRTPPNEYNSIIGRFCHKIDGKSGERMFNLISRLIPK